jgi:hypothetical protein
VGFAILAEDDRSLAGDRIARFPGLDLGLRHFLERDLGELRIIGRELGGLEEIGRSLDLVGPQRFHRVLRPLLLRQSGDGEQHQKQNEGLEQCHGPRR